MASSSLLEPEERPHKRSRQSEDLTLETVFDVLSENELEDLDRYSSSSEEEEELQGEDEELEFIATAGPPLV